MSDRRYSDEEFGLILRKATELQALGAVSRGSGPPAPGGGMSLEEIQAIAREVGIDPALVAQAAGLVAGPGGPAEGFLTLRYALADSVPGALSEEDKVRVLQAIREAAGQHGVSELAGSGVEWSTPEGEGSQIQVSVYPLDDRREVRVSVDRGTAAVLSHLLPTLGGAFAAMITASVLEPASAWVGAALVAGGMGGGFTLGRALWTTTGRRVRERAQRILGAAGGALRRPGPTPTSAAPTLLAATDAPPASPDSTGSGARDRRPTGSAADAAASDDGGAG
ncbi:MAG TPA: hypothetical protein VK858_16510 [Longimicrobiales bacterium]|nr:hypothetical protein [Longimicrobiales bacterium]